jgi:hypothetical protein
MGLPVRDRSTLGTPVPNRCCRCSRRCAGISVVGSWSRSRPGSFVLSPVGYPTAPPPSPTSTVRVCAFCDPSPAPALQIPRAPHCRLEYPREFEISPAFSLTVRLFAPTGRERPPSGQRVRAHPDTLTQDVQSIAVVNRQDKGVTGRLRGCEGETQECLRGWPSLTPRPLFPAWQRGRGGSLPAANGWQCRIIPSFYRLWGEHLLLVAAGTRAARSRRRAEHLRNT